MRRAFTLLELLVVVGIMGLLGTASIAGYRGATLGMEERGAVENASAVFRSARERALVDRKVVAVKYWNETKFVDPDDANAIVVIGKAVAVRSAGRISWTEDGGKRLFDEFSDIEATYPSINAAKNTTGGNEAAQSENSKVTEQNSGSMYLYQLKNLSSGMGRSIVSDYVFCKAPLAERYLSGKPVDTDNGNLYPFAFYVKDQGDAQTWEAGDAYGFSFIEIELPRGYIFGKNYSSSLSNPVDGEGTVVFSRDGDVISGQKSLQICAFRPQQGKMTPVAVGQTRDPTQDLKN